ncbi:MAG TPA: hypothetical protein DCL48_00435 [Alphaproteobacteria bacterium]|nr:hypothetical protein [Alphaproteobacteria bacterium]
MFKRDLITALIALTASAAAFAHDYTKGALDIGHPWAKETAAKAPVGAGFLTINNKGATADRLIAIKTKVSATTELHTMSMEDGVMRMRELEQGLDVPAGKMTTLEPGADHVMFMGLKAPLKAGETFAATLVFEKAGEVPVEFKVEPRGTTPPAHNH